ncbi:MAG TPA: low temperature requirement protein A [Acidimicrobiales bacterium]
MSARRRDGATVTPLELFFDLVFVLALTRCSALMGSEHLWRNVAQGLLVLGVLWWAWVGYAWLTSVVDPDEWLPRVVVFLAMAGMLVMALCVPHAFDDRAFALALAGAYAVVRIAHVFLFAIAAEDDPMLARSVSGLAVGMLLGVSLIAVAAFCDGWVQGGLWLLALVIDMGVPFLFGSEGWHLEPAHFAERHGLIVIIALGESIVALGAGTTDELDGGLIATAVLGVLLAAAMWWSYFDVGSVLAARRLVETPPGKEQNEMARDGYSFLHFPIIAGIVLVAFALHHALLHVTEPLDSIASVVLGGGLAVFLLGQVAFKRRVVGTLSRQRLVAAVVALASIPLLRSVDAWVGVVVAAVVMWGLIGYEVWRYGEARSEARRWESSH